MTVIERGVILGLGSSVLAFLILTHSVGAAAACGTSLLRTTASIDFIDPDGGTVIVRHNGSAPRKVPTGACLVPGDVVFLPSDVKLARVFVGDRLLELRPDQDPYPVQGGVGRVTRRMAAYFSDLAAVLGGEPTPDLPRPTASRALDLGQRGSTNPQPIPALRVGNVPQEIPGKGLVNTLIVAWDAKAGRSHCDLRANGRASTESAETTSPWCAVELGESMTDGTLQVSFDDPQIESDLRWQIKRVEPAKIPRPDWLKTDPATLEPAEIVSWGVWLYREAGPEWRLAGLAMLYSHRESSWIAARAYRMMLTNEPRLGPRRTAVSP
jgi:hypothetical protein